MSEPMQKLIDDAREALQRLEKAAGDAGNGNLAYVVHYAGRTLNNAVSDFYPGGERADGAGGDGPTGIEAARIVEQYLTMRSTLDDGDAANIIHILHGAGVRFSGPTAAPPSGGGARNTTYWDAGTVRGPICDEVVIKVLQDSGLLSRELADDDVQVPLGGVWKHVEDMASRGLILIENNIARIAKERL